MKRLYNADHQPAVVRHDMPAVQPGAAHNFADEEIEAGVAGVWSEEPPRKRVAKSRGEGPAKPADTDPDDPGEKENPR